MMWYDRIHDAVPWMPGDSRCRCGRPIHDHLHTPRLDVSIVRDAGLAFGAILVVLVLFIAAAAAPV